MMNSSLKVQAKSGMLWSFMIQGGTQIINFVVSVLLARLLMPADFGLIGMIAIFIAISQALVNGGFSASLIRTKNADNTDYSTVFFINLLFSVVLYILLFLLAPLIAQFYEQTVLTLLLRVLGLILVLNAFSLVQSTKLNKSLNFKMQFQLQIPALVISAAVSIWMAMNGYGVWSLVVKDLIFAFVANILLWTYSRWQPSLVFDKKKLKAHFNFGYKLSLTQIINTSFDNLYKVLIGKFFSAAQLGFFTRAKSLEQLPSGFFVNAFNRVAFPLLASINDETTRLKNIYSRLMKLIVFVILPILVYLGIVAEPFIRWLLTEKWLPAVPYFQLLVISGMFYPIHKYNLNICNVKGRSDLVLKLSMLQNVLLLIGAVSIVWYGIYGLLYSLVIVNIIVTFINAFVSGNLINYGLKKQIKDLFPTFILNIVLGILLYSIQFYWLQKFNDLSILVIVGSVYTLLYILLGYVFKFSALGELKNLKINS